MRRCDLIPTSVFTVISAVMIVQFFVVNASDGNGIEDEWKIRPRAFPLHGNPFGIRSQVQADVLDGEEMRQRAGDGVKKKVVCYLTGAPSAWLRNDTSVLNPVNIPPNSCNVINLMDWAYVDIDNLSLNWKESFLGDWRAALRTILQLKQRNDWLLMVTIGGGRQPSSSLAALVVAPGRDRLLAEFAVNVRNFLAYSGMDGLDIDWEFPAWLTFWRQRPGFLHLIRHLRDTFSSPPWNLQLSVAAAAVEGIINSAYTMPKMAEYVDWVNVMSYDYHGFVWYLPFTGHNAPLLPKANDRGVFEKLNVRWSVERWLGLGMPPEKIMLGIPVYGRNYKLLTPDAHELGAIATSGGWANYPDICSITNDQVNGHVVWDEEARVPYCYRGSDWISYDDERSIREKMALIAEFGLGGAMVFSLDTDDFAGVCDGKGESKFPLLNVVVENLH